MFVTSQALNRKYVLWSSLLLRFNTLSPFLPRDTLVLLILTPTHARRQMTSFFFAYSISYYSTFWMLTPKRTNSPNEHYKPNCVKNQTEHGMLPLFHLKWRTNDRNPMNLVGDLPGLLRGSTVILRLKMPCATLLPFITLCQPSWASVQGLLAEIDSKHMPFMGPCLKSAGL